MSSFLGRLGRAAVRRRRLVVAAWALVAIVVTLLGQLSGGRTSDAFEIGGVEAQRALDVLKDDFPAAAGTSAQVVFAAPSGTLTDTAAAAAVAGALEDVATQPHVIAVSALHESPDGRIGYADVQYDGSSEEIGDTAYERLETTVDDATRSGAVQMELGGDLPSEAAQEVPGGQEVIGLAAAVVVLLVAFGSVIAMGLPIGLALVGMATSFGLITLVASVIEVSTVAPTIAAMIGLGVGIDYALFILTRHRENLRAGMTVEEAAGRAVATSGAAVLFAGTTVVIAICGLAIAGITMVTVMGLMAGLTVAVMVALALTLLPALLGFAGHKVEGRRLAARRRARANKESSWHRWGRQIAAHPWRYLGAGIAALAILAAPLASLRLGMTDNGTSPTSMTTRRAYDLLAEGFGAGFNGPLVIAVRLGDASVDDLAPLAAAIAADPGVAEVTPAEASPDGGTAVLRVVPTTAPQAAATTTLVHHLRNDVIPAALAELPRTEAYVGGQTALFVDMSTKVSSRLPWFIGAVLLVSVFLLMVIFRSVAVPLKAAAMNLLSIGASYGVIVAVFQWGWLKELIGLHQTVPIVSFMPMMLFAILFGLSMDYEVFLLSRVREEYLHGRDNGVAVIEGIAATGRVITSAALIMISVFAAFVLGDDPMVKMFGLGLATAVLLDATVVRVVLVPATMTLLGDWNWWLPRWLDRRLPRLDLEGGASRPAADEEPWPDDDEPVADEERVPALAPS